MTPILKAQIEAVTQEAEGAVVELMVHLQVLASMGGAGTS